MNLREKRQAKVRACKILTNMNLPHLGEREFAIVGEKVGLPTQMIRRTYKNWILYGYVDGTAKDGHLDPIISVNTANPDIRSDTKKITFARLKKALKLYFSGTKIKDIRTQTGIGASTLYSAIKTLQTEGTIFGRKIYNVLTEFNDVDLVRAKMYVLAKNKGRSPKQIAACRKVTAQDRLRYTQVYNTIVSYLN